MKTLLKYILYLMYSLTAALFFLYIRFPADAAKKYITTQVQTNYPDIHVSMQRVTPAFPIGVNILSGSVRYRDDAVIDMDDLKILFQPSTLLRSKTGYYFCADADGGKLEGTLQLVKKDPLNHVQLDAELSKIKIESIPILKKISREKLTGICNGKVRYVRKDDSWGAADAELSLSDCSVVSDSKVSSLNNIQFEQVSANVDYKEQYVDIKNCSLKGSQMDGRFSGSVTLKYPLDKSLLNLTGTVTPHHRFLAALNEDLPENLFKKKRTGSASYPFEVKGSLDNPLLLLK